MILDLHIHSKYSFDSILHPKDILKVAKNNGLNGIAITDHNSIKGSIEAKTLNRDKNFLVIIGAEFTTDKGDIIGLFLKENIKTRKILTVIEMIKRQGGIVVLPHPFRGHKLTKEIVEKVDVIESFNSRTSREKNINAEKLAIQYKKPMIAGSDAHFSTEIGSGKIILKSNNVRDELMHGKIELITKSTPQYLESASQIIKSLKTGAYFNLPIQLTYLLKNIVKKRK